MHCLKKNASHDLTTRKTLVFSRFRKQELFSRVYTPFCLHVYIGAVIITKKYRINQ